MKRAELARALATAAPGHVVFTGLGTASRAWKEADAANPTYYCSDPMGVAPAFALGAAIARPDLDFLLLEGDGDLTMGLASLLTIAGARPPNLRVVVFHNDRYETGGGQPLAAAGHADLAQLAAAAGWSWTASLLTDEAANVVDRIQELLAAPGPAMLVVEVDVEPAPYGAAGEESGSEARYAFQLTLRTWEQNNGSDTNT